MDTVILAAGRGTRLGRYTTDTPKCLTELAGHTLLDRSLTTLAQFPELAVTVVGGYRAEQLAAADRTVVVNERAAETNIIGSLARGLDGCGWPDRALVIYGDIVFEPMVVAAALSDQDCDVTLPVNTHWRRLWKLRMSDPLSDAETLTLSADRTRVTGIGSVPTSYDDIQGQFMGVLQLGPAAVSDLKTLDPDVRDHLDTTTWLSRLVESGRHVRPVPVEGGWLEVDTEADLELYRRMTDEGTLGELCRLNGHGG